MSCGHFKRIIFDDSKLHRCEFCGGAALITGYQKLKRRMKHDRTNDDYRKYEK